MSKRMGLFGKRFQAIKIRATGSDGKGSSLPVIPMTRGQALILARGILGPSASVLQDSTLRFIGVGIREVKYIATAHDWETALKQAADSPEARDWSDRQIDEGNEIALAEDNLKKTGKKVAEGKFRQFMNGLLTSSKKKEEGKVKDKENYELWKEGREEEYQGRLHRTKLLAAMEPAERAAFLEEEKYVEKILRRNDYDQTPFWN